MRRRPHEDQAEHQHRGQRNITRYSRPAHHWGKGPCRATNDDILRGRAFQPHRVNYNIERDGKGQEPRRNPIGRKAKEHNRHDRERKTDLKRLLRGDTPRRHRARGGALHNAVNIGIIPHIQRARRPRTNRDEQNGTERDEQRLRLGGRDNANKSREHHQRHHTRLKQQHIIPKACFFGVQFRGFRRFGGDINGCIAHLQARPLGDYLRNRQAT